MDKIKPGDRIEAIRSGNHHNQGDQDTCIDLGYIECEEYLTVRLDSQVTIGPILADNWKPL